MALSLSLGFILKPHCQSLNQNQGKNAGCQLANMLLFMFMGKNLSYDKSKLLCTVQLQQPTWLSNMVVNFLRLAHHPSINNIPIGDQENMRSRLLF